MKHTKGEWFVATDNNVYSQHGDARIAIVEADFNISEQEAEANARLIASSPELLEACEWAVKQFKILADKGKYPEHMLTENGGEGIMVLRNAIKKAKGE